MNQNSPLTRSIKSIKSVTFADGTQGIEEVIDYRKVGDPVAFDVQKIKDAVVGISDAANKAGASRATADGSKASAAQAVAQASTDDATAAADEAASNQLDKDFIALVDSMSVP